MFPCAFKACFVQFVIIYLRTDACPEKFRSPWSHPHSNFACTVRERPIATVLCLQCTRALPSNSRNGAQNPTNFGIFLLINLSILNGFQSKIDECQESSFLPCKFNKIWCNIQGGDLHHSHTHTHTHDSAIYKEISEKVVAPYTKLSNYFYTARCLRCLLLPLYGWGGLTFGTLLWLQKITTYYYQSMQHAARQPK